MNIFLTFLLALTPLSFDSAEKWEILHFDAVAANDFELSPSGMEIRVENSASPAVHIFESVRTVDTIILSGRIQGDLEIEPSEIWTTGKDDSLLRFGVISTGSKKLSTFEKLTAPNWVKRLSSILETKGTGIGKIECFLLMPDSAPIGKSRVNPDSALFHETIVATPSDDGTFEIEIRLPQPIESPGFWILADGDDTESSFTTTIEKIEFSQE